MAQIRFLKNSTCIDVPEGTNLMAALLANDIPVASSCHGKGICSRCHVRLVEGGDQLEAESEFVLELKKRNRIPDGHRISCQTAVHGNITIDTSYW